VPSYDQTALALLNDDYLRIAGNNAVDTGRRTFEFQAVREGRHRLVFEKRMGWKFTAEDRRVFVIRVAGRS
jgi:predicted secreted protein